MDEVAQSTRELTQLIVDYNFDQALNKFYSDDIISIENEGQPIVGLAAYKVAAKRFFGNVSNYSAKLKNCIISGDISVMVWHYEFDHKEWGHWDKIQISVQRWQGGKIIHERHHYS